MTTHDPASAPPERPGAPRQPLPWLLILGLSSLALLWPLTALAGIGEGAPRALAIVGIIAATWIVAVGVGRVAHPVLTLALAGLGHGLVGLVVAALVPGGAGPWGDAASWWVLVPALAIYTGAGALAGLAAWGVQTLLVPRGAR